MGARTVGAWMRLNSTTAPNSSIIEWGASSNGARWGAWHDAATDHLRLIAFGGTSNGGPDISDGEWHHIAIGVDANETVGDARLWIDGILHPVTGGATLTRAINTSGANNVRIGDTISPGESPFGGLIDEVAAWSTLKSVEEIAVIHGLGHFEGRELNDPFIDEVLTAFTTMDSAATADGSWSFALASELGTSGSDPIGTIGGSAGVDAFIVLDATGNGVQFAAAVPEPASVAIWSLLGLGLAGIGYFRTRSRK